LGGPLEDAGLAGLMLEMASFLKCLHDLEGGEGVIGGVEQLRRGFAQLLVVMDLDFRKWSWRRDPIAPRTPIWPR
jgi:hypothetical protein